MFLVQVTPHNCRQSRQAENTAIATFDCFWYDLFELIRNNTFFYFLRILYIINLRIIMSILIISSVTMTASSTTYAELTKPINLAILDNSNALRSNIIPVSYPKNENKKQVTIKYHPESYDQLKAIFETR